MSGWAEVQAAGRSSEQVHLARPVVPGGQGWMAVSPALVQFQARFLAVAGAQWCGRSSAGGDCSLCEVGAWLEVISAEDVATVVVVLVSVVPVGVVIGILVSGTVLVSASWRLVSELLGSGSNPSGGSGILVSQSCSVLPPCRNQAGSGFLVVGELLGTQP